MITKNAGSTNLLNPYSSNLNVVISNMRFQFTIRELLLLTVIVAVAIGWRLDHVRLVSDCDALSPQLQPIMARVKNLEWQEGFIKEALAELDHLDIDALKSKRAELDRQPRPKPKFILP